MAMDLYLVEVAGGVIPYSEPQSGAYRLAESDVATYARHVAQSGRVAITNGQLELKDSAGNVRETLPLEVV